MKKPTIAEIIELLELTGSAIGQLTTTCCQVDKSARMTALLGEFKTISTPRETTSYGNSLIDFAEKSGGIIGSMHVTCCTSEREKIYQQLLKNINKLFLLAWSLKGVSHE